jgi:hypothetical protein
MIAFLQAEAACEKGRPGPAINASKGKCLDRAGEQKRNTCLLDFRLLANTFQDSISFVSIFSSGNRLICITTYVDIAG